MVCAAAFLELCRQTQMLSSTIVIENGNSNYHHLKILVWINLGKGRKILQYTF